MDSSLSVGAGVHTLDFPPEYFPSDGYADLHDPLHAKVLLFVKKRFPARSQPWNCPPSVPGN